MRYQQRAIDILSVAITVIMVVACIGMIARNQKNKDKLEVIYGKLDEIASTTDAQAAEIRELTRINDELREQITKTTEQAEKLETRLDNLEKTITDEIKRIDTSIDILTEAKAEQADGVIETAYTEPETEEEPRVMVASAMAVKTEHTYMEELEDSDNPTYKPNPNPVPTGPHLTPQSGTFTFEGHTETYYNLDMSVVVQVAQSRGIAGEYHVREDGAKMIGDYIMVAADYSIHPYGSLVNTSLGMGIVVDTGGFIAWNPTGIDIAVSWT